MYFLPLITFFFTYVLAASRSSPPAGALVVSKIPTSGQYSTVQAAVSKLSTSTTTAQSIFIYPGKLTIYGSTNDTTSCTSNSVTITNSLSATAAGSDDLSATVRNWGTNTTFYNLNIANTFGKGSQALAISASAGNQGYYGCSFKGFQDTVLAETGTQLYAKSCIEGATDFIFSQHATAWFQSVNIGVLAASKGYVTASGRASSSDASWYVLSKCTIAAASGNSVPAGAYYLGRPWGDYTRVVVQQTSMTNVINSAGWSIWNVGDEQTDHVTFEEYGNSGAGASGTRASFSSKVSSAVAISSILGSGYTSWADTSYLS